MFTGRFGPGSGEVLFDRICRENGVRHILTAPRSPTTTGKVERWHKTLRREFLDGKVFTDIEAAQAAVDAWVHHYNHDRPHQSIGMVAPWERFRLADPSEFEDPEAPAVEPATTRKVGRSGKISFAGYDYRIGVWLAGEAVEVTVDAGLVSVHHRGVLVATHAQHHRPDKEAAALQRRPKRTGPRQATVGQAGDTQGRQLRLHLFRRNLLSSRKVPSAASGAVGHRRRRGRDLLRWPSHQDPPDQP